MKDELKELSDSIKSLKNTLEPVLSLGPEFIHALNNRIPIKLVYVMLIILFLGQTLVTDGSLLGGFIRQVVGEVGL